MPVSHGAGLSQYILRPQGGFLGSGSTVGQHCSPVSQCLRGDLRAAVATTAGEAAGGGGSGGGQ